METIAISFGSIILLAIIFYFVIKSAVRNGINESMLFSNEQRESASYQELEEVYTSIGQEVPNEVKEYYGKH
ncbi:MAG: DUF6019 family protein [Defluviitaleaceae bacterium]|nr:DUF6019 family protein [Defluviitaleaceae bacterium]